MYIFPLQKSAFKLFTSFSKVKLNVALKIPLSNASLSKKILPPFNLKILDISETFMKRIVVSDTQIGTSSEPLRLSQSNDGRFVVYKVVNNQEEPLNLIDNMWPFESNIGIGIRCQTTNGCSGSESICPTDG